MGKNGGKLGLGRWAIRLQYRSDNSFWQLILSSRKDCLLEESALGTCLVMANMCSLALRRGLSLSNTLLSHSLGAGITRHWLENWCRTWGSKDPTNHSPHSDQLVPFEGAPEQHILMSATDWLMLWDSCASLLSIGRLCLQIYFIFRFLSNVAHFKVNKICINILPL